MTKRICWHLGIHNYNEKKCQYESLNSMRIKFFFTQFRNLSWTEEWMCAMINLTGMTYDTVCVCVCHMQLVTKQGQWRRQGGRGKLPPYRWTSKNYVICVCFHCHGTFSYHTTNTSQGRRAKSHVDTQTIPGPLRARLGPGEWRSRGPLQAASSMNKKSFVVTRQ